MSGGLGESFGRVLGESFERVFFFAFGKKEYHSISGLGLLGLLGLVGLGLGVRPSGVDYWTSCSK